MKNFDLLLHIGVNSHTMDITLVDDVNCLPCEITQYRLAKFTSPHDLRCKVHSMEDLGYHVVVNLSDYFYETGE